MMREQKTANVEVFNIDGLECFEKDGVAYLKLETVARGLGFTQTQIKNGNEYVSVRWERVRKYLDEFGFPHEWGKDGLPEYIPEDIFYRLAMKANNETAKNFQIFVAQKVLPSLRKHGAYIMGQETMDDDLLLAKAVLAANKMIEERNKKIQQLEVSIAQLTPSADYCQEVLASESLIATTQIAKDFGFRSAQQLNKVLSDLGIQYKVNDSWVLRAAYADKGYVKTKTFTYQYGSQKATAQHNYWTEQGRKFLYEKLKKNNLLPKSFQQFLKHKPEEVLPC